MPRGKGVSQEMIGKSIGKQSLAPEFRRLGTVEIIHLTGLAGERQRLPMVFAIGFEIVPAEVVCIIDRELDVSLGIPPEGHVVVGILNALALLLFDGLKLSRKDLPNIRQIV